MKTLTQEEHLDDLLRHIELVQNACILLGKRFIAQGQKEFGKNLIARGLKHDASKFFGIEWEYLHRGEVPKDMLKLAIKQHVETNCHHPEYWGGIEYMPSISLAEMICDWYARAQEKGTGLREWIVNHGIERFNIKIGSKTHTEITQFVDILLDHSFVKGV